MPTAEWRDAELVVMLLSDSDAEREVALEELYRRYAGAVMGFVAACSGDQATAEQVVEDIFVRLAESPHSYDASEQTLRSHLVEQAHLRHVQDLRVHQGGMGLWQVLQPEERLTLALAHFGGMTRDKVAQVLGLPRNTVSEMMRCTLQRLRAGA